MQVVTSENFPQLITEGKVPEFKAPEAAIAKAADAAVVEPVKDGEQPRGEDGKFVAKDAEVTTDTAAKAADEDDEDRDLPERVRKQIGKKHRRMMEAEEYARELRVDREAVRERAEKAERELEVFKSKAGPAPVEKDSDEPKPDAYKTVAEYTDALTDYKVDRKWREKEAAAEQQRVETAARTAQAEFNVHIAKVAKEIPDYADVISACEIDMPPYITKYIADSGEVGIRLGYHLAKHTDEYDRIAKLSPIRAIAELGKLETTLEKKPAPVKADGTQAVSRAPAPITPLDSGSTTTVTKDPSKMTVQELREYDRMQSAAKRR